MQSVILVFLVHSHKIPTIQQGKPCYHAVLPTLFQTKRYVKQVEQVLGQTPEWNPVNACRGFPTELTSRGKPSCIVVIFLRVYWVAWNPEPQLIEWLDSCVSLRCFSVNWFVYFMMSPNTTISNRYIYSQPSFIRTTFIRYPKIHYLNKFCKVPRGSDKWGLTVQLYYRSTWKSFSTLITPKNITPVPVLKIPDQKSIVTPQDCTTLFVSHPATLRLGRKDQVKRLFSSTPVPGIVYGWLVTLCY